MRLGAPMISTIVLLTMLGCEKQRDMKVYTTVFESFFCRVRGGVPECRGRNLHGVLGHDRFDEESESWVRAAPLDRIKALAVGTAHICALRSDGRVYCWGLDDDGQLGDGPVSRDDGQPYLARTTPVIVPGIEHVVAISATSFASCAMTSRGEVYCWGSGLEAGRGRAGSQPPERVAIPAAQKIAANLAQTCVLTAQHQVYCWDGWVLDEEGNERIAVRPTHVPLADGADDITVGTSSMCALANGEKRRCWEVHGKRWDR